MKELNFLKILKMVVFLAVFGMSSVFAQKAKTPRASDERTYQQMEAASEDLTTIGDPTRAPSDRRTQVLKDSWEVLHESTMSPAGKKASDEYLDRLFTLTDNYSKADNSGSEMDVFSDYYGRNKKRVKVYQNTETKVPKETKDRLIDRAEKYGTTDDKAPSGGAERDPQGTGTKGQP